MGSIRDAREPFEVYEAAEGDPTALIEYLRSNKPMNDWMRQELADWLEGKLPVKFPRGHPTKDRIEKLRLIGAWRLYESLKKGELDVPSGLLPDHPKADDRKILAAMIYGVDTETFLEFMRRPLSYRNSLVSLKEFDGHARQRYLMWKKSRNK